MALLSTLRMYLQRTKALDEPSDLYTHNVPLLGGGALDLRTLRGRPTLFVNTASKCGYTPQFEGLQALYDRFGPRGLQIVGTPSADFLGQEHDDAEATSEVCHRNYGVAFPMTETMSVRADPSPLWRDIARQPGSKPPVWNFTKYLVDGEGRLVRRWATKVTPDDPDLVGAIEAALPAS